MKRFFCIFGSLIAICSISALGLFGFASCSSDTDTKTEYVPVDDTKNQSPPDREKFIVSNTQIQESDNKDLKTGSIEIKETRLLDLEYFSEAQNNYIAVSSLPAGDFDSQTNRMQGLKKGVYSFRFKATQDKNSSFAINVTVGSDSVPTKPAIPDTQTKEPTQDTTKQNQTAPLKQGFVTEPATKGDVSPTGKITIQGTVSLERLQYAKATATTTTLTWQDVTTRTITGLEEAYYYFRYKADATYNASAATEVIVAQKDTATLAKQEQSAPDATKFSVTAESYEGAKDAKIQITLDSITRLVYKTIDTDWQDVPATKTITGLSKGNYSFRYKEDTQYNQSGVTVITIGLKPIEPEAGDSDKGDSDVEAQEVPAEKEGLKLFSSLNVSDMSSATFNKETITNNVKIIADSTNTITVDGSNKKLGSVTYSKRLKLGGAGDKTKRNITIYVGPNVKGTLTALLMSSDSKSTDRAFMAGDTEVGKAPASFGQITATVQADAQGYIALYSALSGINIYQLTFTSSTQAGGSSGSGSSGGSTSGDKSNVSDVQKPTLDNTGLAPTYNNSTKVGKRSVLSDIVGNISKIKKPIWAAPDGTSSGDGTKENPLDIATAITRVEAGGAVVLKSGTYKLSQTVQIAYGNNGSRAAMKYILPDSKQGAILDFSSQPTADTSRGFAVDGDFWHIYGITCYNAGDNGMYVTGKNNIIERCIFQANQDTGLQIARRASSLSNMSDWPSDNLILNCTSFDNKDDKTGENADGFASKLTCGQGNVFDGCISYANCDDGWDLYAKPATGSIGIVTIQNCVALQNGKTTTGANYANGDMNGFKLGGSTNQCPTPHIIKNCLSFLNGKDGFTDNGNGGALQVSNCTSYANVVSNFNFYRTYKGNFSNLITATGKGTDKFGTKDTPSTIEKAVYYNGGKYYHQKEQSPVKNGQKIGTQVSDPYASEFVSTTAPTMDLTLDGKCRNKDGTINMAGFLEVKSTSAYQGYGAKFGTEAQEVLDITLQTN